MATIYICFNGVEHRIRRQLVEEKELNKSLFAIFFAKKKECLGNGSDDSPVFRLLVKAEQASRAVWFDGLTEEDKVQRLNNFLEAHGLSPMGDEAWRGIKDYNQLQAFIWETNPEVEVLV